jgi:hypothetical protein
MADRQRILIFVTAMILIPVLLGMTPMNLFQKLSIPCPHCKDKQIQRASSCLFNTIVSQDDFSIASLNSLLQEQESIHLFHIKMHHSIQSNIFPVSAPLRC